jgi:hypothetical protein
MKTPTQKQRALYWQAICLLFNGGEPALIKALQSFHQIMNEMSLTK